ncbi:uncharacterized protein [Globicephala melas]|uniref:uncharacterized protein n=1 Tax=Globicephala melas TaxID=9731 RepID=UPI00293D9958|nr:uncharacterized protein LOC132597527 [Globicephala melas]
MGKKLDNEESNCSLYKCSSRVPFSGSSPEPHVWQCTTVCPTTLKTSFCPLESPFKVRVNHVPRRDVDKKRRKEGQHPWKPPSFPGLFHPLSSAADVSYLTLPVGDTGALQPSPLSAHPNRTPVLLKCRSVLPAPVILDSSRGQQIPAGHVLDGVGSLPTSSETSVKLESLLLRVGQFVKCEKLTVPSQPPRMTSPAADCRSPGPVWSLACFEGKCGNGFLLV